MHFEFIQSTSLKEVIGKIHTIEVKYNNFFNSSLSLRIVIVILNTKCNEMNCHIIDETYLRQITIGYLQ